MAYFRRCSSIVHTCGYEVFDCATKYAGVISVTEFAQKQRHLVVSQVCDMNVSHRIYKFSPGLTTLPNKKKFSYMLRWSKSLAKSPKIIIRNRAISIGTFPVLLARSLIIKKLTITIGCLVLGPLIKQIFTLCKKAI